MVRWLVTLSFLLACSRAGDEGEAKRWATPPPGKDIAIPSVHIPVTVDGGARPAITTETACQDGINCDVFTIHLTGSAEDYAGQQLVVKITFLPASDYDLYVHKDTVNGKVVFPAGNGSQPSDNEQVAINPATSGAGDYVVHIVYADVVPTDQYQGTANLQSATGGGATPPPMRTANYVSGGITFSNSIPLKAPTTLRDGEPSNRTDFAGNAYVGAIRGFPAGVDVWRFDLNPLSPSFDPNMRVPIYRGQPDAFSPAATEAELGGDGGGDIDLAVPFSLPPWVFPCGKLGGPAPAVNDNRQEALP